LTYYVTLFGVILLLPLTLSEGFVQQIQTISPSVILAILYMGIFASGFGYLFYNLSIKEIGATKTASFVYSRYRFSLPFWRCYFSMSRLPG